MLCRSCGYELWNLKQPVCPECGNGFDLRTYAFEPQSVAFACPDCGHLHPGTGWQYVPALTKEMVCQGCGRSIQVVQMQVVPLVDHALGVPTDIVPWEERKEIGRWRAWWRTMKLVIGSPTRLADMIQPTCSLRPAFDFAALAYALCFLIQPLLILGILLIPLITSQQAGNLWVYDFWVLLGVLLACLVITIGLGPLFLVLLPGVIAHGLLKIMAKPAHGLRTTLICGVYAQGPMAFGATPLLLLFSFCAPLVYLGFFAWVLWLCIYLTARVQRVSKQSAAIAWLAWPMLFMLFWIGLIVWHL